MDLCLIEDQTQRFMEKLFFNAEAALAAFMKGNGSSLQTHQTFIIVPHRTWHFGVFLCVTVFRSKLMLAVVY